LKLKFVALRIPEIIGGTQKISAVPGYALFSQIIETFVRMDAVNTSAKFEVPKIIGGSPKIWEVPG